MFGATLVPGVPPLLPLAGFRVVGVRVKRSLAPGVNTEDPSSGDHPHGPIRRGLSRSALQRKVEKDGKHVLMCTRDSSPMSEMLVITDYSYSL